MSKISTPKPVQDYLDRGFSRKDAERLVELNEQIQRISSDLRSFADACLSFYPNGLCTDKELLSRVAKGYYMLSKLVREHSEILSTPFLNTLRDSLLHVGCIM